MYFQSIQYRTVLAFLIFVFSHLFLSLHTTLFLLSTGCYSHFPFLYHFPVLSPSVHPSSPAVWQGVCVVSIWETSGLFPGHAGVFSPMAPLGPGRSQVSMFSSVNYNLSNEHSTPGHTLSLITFFPEHANCGFLELCRNTCNPHS